jgi:hypothetical protein
VGPCPALGRDGTEPVTTGLFVQSLNELIDSFGRRDAAVSRHVPEVVLLLLHGTFLIACVIIGYACGIGGQRPHWPPIRWSH